MYIGCMHACMKKLHPLVLSHTHKRWLLLILLAIVGGPIDILGLGLALPYREFVGCPDKFIINYDQLNAVFCQATFIVCPAKPIVLYYTALVQQQNNIYLLLT